MNHKIFRMKHFLKNEQNARVSAYANSSLLFNSQLAPIIYLINTEAIGAICSMTALNMQDAPP